tara:strand:+ start:273 stop:485 length:213 start_codon:yes stop_codon:yes gene_type:complete
MIENKHSYAGYHKRHATKYGDTLFEDSTNSIKKNPSINEIKYAPLSPDINFPKKLNKKTIERMHIKTLKL